MRKWRENPENARKNREYAKEYYYRKGASFMSNKTWMHRNTKHGRKMLVLQQQRRRARKSSVLHDLTGDDIDFLLMIQENKCCKCGASFFEAKYTIDHIIPLYKGGDTTLRNIQLLCRPCNSSKGTKTEMYRVPYEMFV